MKINPKNLDFRQSHHLGTGVFVPRPILLISTIGEDGVFNVAPFATVNRVSHKPLLVGFEVNARRDGQKKDTLKNIEFSKEFVVSVVDETLAEAMNKAAADYPSYVDEFKESGLTPLTADIVKAPLVAESPVNLECQLLQILQFGESPRFCNYIIGEVVLAHVRDDLWVDGDIDSRKLKAIGRLEPVLYCRTTDIFELPTIHERAS
ncbi:MAG: flavin reductase family protein [Chloroflexota bacterium]